jgi:hypothetical protein
MFKPTTNNTEFLVSNLVLLAGIYMGLDVQVFASTIIPKD